MRRVRQLDPHLGSLPNETGARVEMKRRGSHTYTLRTTYAGRQRATGISRRRQSSSGSIVWRSRERRRRRSAIWGAIASWTPKIRNGQLRMLEKPRRPLSRYTQKRPLPPCRSS